VFREFIWRYRLIVELSFKRNAYSLAGTLGDDRDVRIGVTGFNNSVAGGERVRGEFKIRVFVRVASDVLVIQ
jgi:hypothetical protein